jgi:hypothetical protein
MKEALAQLGIKDINEHQQDLITFQWRNFESYSPVDGQLIAKLKQPLLLIMKSNGISCCFQNFRTMPAPQRGKLYANLEKIT